jgi:hypothetical protein
MTSIFNYSSGWVVAVWMLSDAPTEGRVALVYLIVGIAAFVIDLLRLVARKRA